MSAGAPPPEPSADSAAATAELRDRLASAEAEAADMPQLRESLAVAEAEAERLQGRLEASAAEADSTAATATQVRPLWKDLQLTPNALVVAERQVIVYWRRISQVERRAPFSAEVIVVVPFMCS